MHIRDSQSRHELAPAPISTWESEPRPNGVEDRPVRSGPTRMRDPGKIVSRACFVTGLIASLVWIAPLACVDNGGAGEDSLPLLVLWPPRPPTDLCQRLDEIPDLSTGSAETISNTAATITALPAGNSDLAAGSVSTGGFAPNFFRQLPDSPDPLEGILSVAGPDCTVRRQYSLCDGEPLAQSTTVSLSGCPPGDGDGLQALSNGESETCTIDDVGEKAHLLSLFIPAGCSATLSAAAP